MSHPQLSPSQLSALILGVFLVFGSQPVHSQATVADAAGLHGMTAPVAGNAESDQDFRLNHCFNIGNRDGLKDRRVAARRRHPSKCIAAAAYGHYWLGYQAGFSGTLSYRKDHRSSPWARTRTGR